MESINTRKIRDPWPIDTRERALELYISQDTPNIPAISDELGVPEDTIKYWRKNENWVGKRKELYQSASATLVGDLLSKEVRRRRQMLKDFEYMRDVAIEGVEDEELEFRDKKQAIDSLNMAVKGMADILDRGVSVVFLQEIAQIIIEEVEDEDTKQRLGERLVSLGSVWSTRGLST